MKIQRLSHNMPGCNWRVKINIDRDNFLLSTAARKHIRFILLQGKEPTTDDIAVLYKSKDFIIVNKHHDVKVYCCDHSDPVTVETQLCKLYPECVDENAGFSFR